MAKVIKRTWTTSKGEQREAWIVRYFQNGKQHIETFQRKKDAEEKRDQLGVDIRGGKHVAPSQSITVAVAAENWLAECAVRGLETSTIDTNRVHANKHIVPILGDTKLSMMTTKTVKWFQDELRQRGVSPVMIRKVRASLSSIVSEAQDAGYVAHNCVKAAKRSEGNKRKKLLVGEDIPTATEIKRIINAASDNYRTLLLVTAMTGMRASEVRGLRWSDVNLKAGEIYVRQRADKGGRIGSPKSSAGTRTIPLPGYVVQALKDWQPSVVNLASGTPDGLVFPNPKGKPLSLSSIIRVGLIPAVRRAGLLVPVSDRKRGAKEFCVNGMIPKYAGMHALRHFYASWCINRVEDGGLELPAKVVSERLGHSNISMTLNIYTHLFPRGDDSGKLDNAASKLFA